MRKNEASAKWTGNFKQGKGSLILPAISQPFTFTAASRFENDEGTNPEELIAAAHAGCFSMAFANILTIAGFPPKVINTVATVTMGKKDGGNGITTSELNTRAEVPGISKEKFLELANDAKKNCPVSRALASVDISLNAELVSG